MLMFADDDLLSFDIDPQSAVVAPAHAVESMESIADPNLPGGLDATSVSIDIRAVVAREGGGNERGIGVDVVQVGHFMSPRLDRTIV
jgi:hypothetical protein